MRKRYTQKDWLSHFHFLTFTFLFSLSLSFFFHFHFLTFTFTFSCSLSHLHLLTFSLSLSHFHILTFTLSLKLCGSCHAVAMQLQDFAHIFCRTGKGIAAEVPKVVFVEMLCKILHTYFAAKEKELPLKIVRQFQCCCHAVAMRLPCSCHAVAMLLNNSLSVTFGLDYCLNDCQP